MNNHKVQFVAFNQFTAWEDNVRRTGADSHARRIIPTTKNNFTDSLRYKQS